MRLAGNKGSRSMRETVCGIKIMKFLNKFVNIKNVDKSLVPIGGIIAYPLFEIMSSLLKYLLN